MTIDQCRTSRRCRRVEDIYPTLPNPYTFLSVLPPERVIYTVLDLKEAFFSLPLAPASQPMFAFEWMDPEDRFDGQLTWTRLPQGFKRSFLPSLMSPP